MMEKKRSAGVMVFGIIAIIISLFLLYAYISLLLLPSVNLSILIIPIIFAISFGASGIYILRLKNWARILFLFQMGILALIGLWGARAMTILNLAGIGRKCNLPHVTVGWLVFYFLPFIVSIYFFTRSKVKEQFR